MQELGDIDWQDAVWDNKTLDIVSAKVCSTCMSLLAASQLFCYCTRKQGQWWQ